MTVPGRPSSPGACGAAGLPTGAEPSVTRWGCAGAQAPACAAVGVPQHPRADRQAARARRLTDSQGRTVSFANALVVMTSNVGSAVIAKGGGGLGFQLPGADAEEAGYGRVRALVTEELKQFFRCAAAVQGQRAGRHGSAWRVGGRERAPRMCACACEAVSSGCGRRSSASAAHVT